MPLPARPGADLLLAVHLRLVHNRAYTGSDVDLEWDRRKAATNLHKHGIDFMKTEYDFSGSRRGAPIGASSRKTRITIRIDDDVLAWFRRAAHEQGGASYQTLINTALRDHVEAKEGHLEQTLRRVIREEFPRR